MEYLVLYPLNTSWCKFMSRKEQGKSSQYFSILSTLNDDGYISVEEFKVYSKILTPGILDKDVVHTFNVIDTNWAIPFNSYTPPMDDQQGKFNPWTQLNGNQPPWTALN